MPPDSHGPAARPAEQVAIGLGRGGTLRVEGLWPDQAEALRRAWSRCPPSQEPGLEPSTDADARLRWWSEGREASGAQWDDFHETLAQTAARLVITGGRGRSLMLHAAATADESGRALVLAAPSGTGKTTGSIGLGRRWGYLSDETVVIDPQSLTIDPFPKPLSVLGPGGQRPKRQLGPDELELLSPPPSSHLHAIGVLRRRPPGDQRAPELVRLPLLEALALLIPQTSSLSRLERGLVTLIRTIERAGGAWALHYSEPPGLIGLAEQLMAAPGGDADGAADGRRAGAGVADGAAEPPAAWEPVPAQRLRRTGGSHPGAGRDSEQTVAEPGLVRAAPADDAVVLETPEGPVLLLLRGESFSTLSGIGPRLWDECRAWRRRTELAAQLAAEPGAPQDAQQRVQQAIEELLLRGVLEGSA